MQHYKQFILILSLLISYSFTDSTKVDSKGLESSKKIFVFDIKEDIGPASWRITKKSFEQATAIGADMIIIHMNTYGGMVNYADSIRTIILNSKIPVYVFVDNNAASAGALISIACDGIYMRQGSNIGAATVVTQTGEAAPDKYQSYMRSMMRATAESHGSDTIINTSGDTLVKWFRNPKIAEAMVDQNIEIEGISKKGEVLTFTASEAKKNGFCEGIAENLTEVIAMLEVPKYEIKEFKQTSLDKLIGILMSPAIQGILIMIIVGGIYFELQTPGVGFPLIAAITAAVVYFAPLYLEGIAEHWEILLFIIGIGLIALEIFVVPGFGITGISGIILVITGLTLSMVENWSFDFEMGNVKPFVRALALVIVSTVSSIVLSIYLSSRLLRSNAGFSRFILTSSQDIEEGFTAISSENQNLIGKEGIAITVLRPSGRIEIDGKIFDAISDEGFIEKGGKIKIIKTSTAQLCVIKG